MGQLNSYHEPVVRIAEAIVKETPLSGQSEKARLVDPAMIYRLESWQKQQLLDDRVGWDFVKECVSCWTGT